MVMVTSAVLVSLPAVTVRRNTALIVLLIGTVPVKDVDADDGELAMIPALPLTLDQE